MSVPLIDPSFFATGDRVLVAVSGGADSLALLHVLAYARGDLDVQVIAAHVHHGMRGKAADADVRFLEETCRGWNVPLVVVRADVPALAAKRRISVEEAGRDARYAAFANLAREHGCSKVATAHHADDQAETVLLNLFRGCGIDGLGGIPPRRPLGPPAPLPEIVRPLLHRRRSELDAYCAEHGLSPRHDITNDDRRFRRNRIRADLLPRLTEYDGAVVEHLVRLADQAREEKALLGAVAEALLQQAEASTGGGAEPRVAGGFPVGSSTPETLALDSGALSAANPALARRTLILALRRVGAYEVELDAATVERLLRLARGELRTALDLPGGPFRARREGAAVVLERLRSSGKPAPEAVHVRVPGITTAPEFSLELAVEEAGVPPDLRLPPMEAAVNPGALRPPLVLRAPRRGDRFRPLGAAGTRLLSDLFVDRKVPREERASWPVLADESGILWVVGLAVAERARVGPEMRRCLRLRVRTDSRQVDGSPPRDE